MRRCSARETIRLQDTDLLLTDARVGICPSGSSVNRTTSPESRPEMNCRSAGPPCYLPAVFAAVNTRDPRAVIDTCRAVWNRVTSSQDASYLDLAFSRIQEAFDGRHPDYEPLDTVYHDLEHTLQGTLCLARILDGWLRARVQPAPDDRAVRLGLTAILFHDTGYLKSRGDHAGTGAKFTPIHVQRSAEFAARNLAPDHYSAADIREIQSMIRCTGVNADIRTLHFERPIDRLTGAALASADLLGQMAASDYVEKLPALYAEFAEAAEAAGPAAGGIAGFQSAAELLENTPLFWEHHVLPRLRNDFAGVFRYLNDPWPDGPNEYLQRIEANLDRIRAATAHRGASTLRRA